MLYMYEVLSRCYPSGATRSHIYRGGIYSRGEGSHTSPELPGCPGKKILETTWIDRVINHIIHHVTYKTIMLKKTGELLLCQKNQKIFRQIISFVARSDPGKFYRTYTAYIYFSPLCPSREKNSFDYLRFF